MVTHFHPRIPLKLFTSRPETMSESDPIEFFDSRIRFVRHQAKGHCSFTIPDFLSMMDSNRWFAPCSPVFAVGNRDLFQLQVVGSHPDLPHGPHVGVEIQRVSKLRLHEKETKFSALLKGRVHISVKTADGASWGAFEARLFPSGGTFDTAFLKAALRERAAELLPEGSLTIVCKVELEAFHSIDETVPAPSCKDAKPAAITPSLGDSFLVYCNNPEWSDVSIVCGEHSFSCHKIILSARSDVFAAMFSHEDIAENQGKKVTVNDVEPEVMEKQLQFIYTDKCIVVEESAFDLLAAADKYNINGLVHLCEEFLGSHIRMDNFDQVLLCSFFHEAEQLKKVAMGFVLKNLEEVKKSLGWNAIKKSYPKIMTELIAFILQ